MNVTPKNNKTSKNLHRLSYSHLQSLHFHRKKSSKFIGIYNWMKNSVRLFVSKISIQAFDKHKINSIKAGFELPHCRWMLVSLSNSALLCDISLDFTRLKFRHKLIQMWIIIFNYRIYSRISRPAYKSNWKNIFQKSSKIKKKNYACNG